MRAVGVKGMSRRGAVPQHESSVHHREARKKAFFAAIRADLRELF